MALISQTKFVDELSSSLSRLNFAENTIPKADNYLKVKENGSPSIKYGDINILGYNGFLPEGDKGRKRSKFQFYKRNMNGPNGVVFYSRQALKNMQELKSLISDKPESSYTVAYTFLTKPNESTKGENLIFYDEYKLNKNLDMYQIGRSPEKPIDFVVLDTNHSSHKNINQKPPPDLQKAQKVQLTESTISRFACRLSIERSPPYQARIFAAGFDSSKHIFLGPKAVKWHKSDEEIVDGLTTNGILLSHESSSLCNAPSLPRKWYEVSIEGRLYTLRSPQSMNTCGNLVDAVDNMLRDWSLVDICGATLLWRANDKRKDTPTHSDIEGYIENLNSCKPQCPVRLSTLVVPKKYSNTGQNYIKDNEAYVYLQCGHVQGFHQWGKQENQLRKCPICQKIGPIAPLVPGYEPNFYRGFGSLTHSFVPCGHMTNEITALYWSNITIPSADFKRICPFCATELNEPDGYIKLHFQADG